MVSPIGAGMAGIDRSMQLFQKAADIAADPEGGDYVEGIVDEQAAKAELKASIAVIHTADDMMGTMLDIIA